MTRSPRRSRPRGSRNDVGPENQVPQKAGPTAGSGHAAAPAHQGRTRRNDSASGAQHDCHDAATRQGERQAMTATAGIKVYHGYRDADGHCRILVMTEGDISALPPRLDLESHSPTGFEWGCAGSGPAQAALAILADALGDDRRAIRLHQPFKFEVIAKLPRDQSWKLASDWVCEAAEFLELSRANLRA